MGALSTGGHHPRNIPTPWLIPRTEGGTKEDLAFRGGIYRTRLCEKKGGVEMERKRIFKRIFFFQTSTRRPCVPAKISTEIDRDFSGAGTTGFWDKSGLPEVHACSMHARMLRAAEHGS